MNEDWARKKRPKWVWVISVFFFFSAGWTLLSLYLIETGAIQLQPELQAYFAALTKFDYVVSILIGVANLAGAITLFMLRAISFYLFSAALVGNVIAHLWHIQNKGFAEAVGGAGVFGALLGLAIAGAVCAYTYNLKKRQVLN